jgi:death-on-curing family protein
MGRRVESVDPGHLHADGLTESLEASQDDRRARYYYHFRRAPLPVTMNSFDPMQFLHPNIEDEYKRWLKIVGPETYDTRYAIGMHEVLRAHFLIVDFFIGSEYGIGGVGPRDLSLLHSAIYRQFVAYGLKEKWEEPLQKCATLLFGLVKDHPFHDANKRTAFLVALYQLDCLGRTPRITEKEFEDFIVDIADNRLNKHARFSAMKDTERDPEILFIHDFLKRNSREIDKRPYTVTYHVLNQILKRYGFELANPDNNYIDLVKVEYSKGFLGLRREPKRKETRLKRIGFPGWKKQIGREALQLVRKAAELTPERGYDSKVFFEGADPLSALISIYEGPLRRLANR